MKLLKWIHEFVLIAGLLVLIRTFDRIEPWLQNFLGVNKEVVEWISLDTLVMQYLKIVVLAISVSSILGFVLGGLIHLKQWNGMKELAILLGGLGVTFPSLAIMALLVPSMGYGYEPVVFALVIYGIFPVLSATMEGFQTVERQVVLAAQAMGMQPLEVFWNVELPLASPLILAGLRTSVIISIAAATIGATVGAGGLGLPIVTGIRTGNPVLILKGALPVMLIAMLADRIFYRLEHGRKWK